jgi:hypothetical protein
MSPRWHSACSPGRPMNSNVFVRTIRRDAVAFFVTAGTMACGGAATNGPNSDASNAPPDSGSAARMDSGDGAPPDSGSGMDSGDDAPCPFGELRQTIPDTAIYMCEAGPASSVGCPAPAGLDPNAATNTNVYPEGCEVMLPIPARSCVSANFGPFCCGAQRCGCTISGPGNGGQFDCGGF